MNHPVTSLCRAVEDVGSSKVRRRADWGEMSDRGMDGVQPAAKVSQTLLAAADGRVTQGPMR